MYMTLEHHLKFNGQGPPMPNVFRSQGSAAQKRNIPLKMPHATPMKENTDKTLLLLGYHGATVSETYGLLDSYIDVQGLPQNPG